MFNIRTNKAFSLMEIIIAIVIVAVCGTPVFYLLTSTRTETSKAINYLRAVELANESIEWAVSSKFSELNAEKFSAYNGTITGGSSGELAAIQVGADDSPANAYWQNLPEDLFAYSELSYSDDYNKAFFYREIDIQNVYSRDFADGLLKKVTVRIKWNEGHAVTSLNSPERDRQIELSAFVFNDQSLEY